MAQENQPEMLRTLTELHQRLDYLEKFTEKFKQIAFSRKHITDVGKFIHMTFGVNCKIDENNILEATVKAHKITVKDHGDKFSYIMDSNNEIQLNYDELIKRMKQDIDKSMGTAAHDIVKHSRAVLRQQATYGKLCSI